MSSLLPSPKFEQSENRVVLVDTYYLARNYNLKEPFVVAKTLLLSKEVCDWSLAVVSHWGSNVEVISSDSTEVGPNIIDLNEVTGCSFTLILGQKLILYSSRELNSAICFVEV